MEQVPIDVPQTGEVVQSEPEGSWRVVGAAVRGAAHERMDLPCQDAQGYRVLSSGMLLAVVADGAGTASLSDQGARAAVEESLNALEAALEGSCPTGAEEWVGLVRDAFRAAREATLDLAEKSGESAREYACTLAGVVVSSKGLVAGQIGDGALVCQDKSGELFSVTRLQRGEYANETHFLVEEDALEMAEFEYVNRPVSALALMSDGLIRLAMKMPSQEPHFPFFQPLFRFAAAEANEDEAVGRLALFLGSARVSERTDDDRALVLAVRGGASNRCGASTNRGGA